ncbi:hypothetical protein HC761_02410 [bacterium]|nr:hypothetical protein [bacterium]
MQRAKPCWDALCQTLAKEQLRIEQSARVHLNLRSDNANFFLHGVINDLDLNASTLLQINARGCTAVDYIALKLKLAALCLSNAAAQPATEAGWRGFLVPGDKLQAVGCFYGSHSRAATAACCVSRLC